MILAAPWPPGYGYPEWPIKLNRLVRTIYIAIHHPMHVGRFHSYAFPRWWRILRTGRATVPGWREA